MHDGTRVFLVDFENTGNVWPEALSGARPGDVVILFYTKASYKIELDGLRTVSDLGLDILFRKCGTGKNGLDFQLSSELGWIAARCDALNMPVRFIIVSNDAGYDVLANYWRAMGIQVRRQAFQSMSNQGKTSKKAARSSQAAQGGPARILPRQWPSLSQKPLETLVEASEAIQGSQAEEEADTGEGAAAEVSESRTAAPAVEEHLNSRRGCKKQWAAKMHPAFEKAAATDKERRHFPGCVMAAMELDQGQRMLRVYNDTVRYLGKDRGRKLYNQLKPVLTDIFTNGPFPPPRPHDDEEEQA